MADTSQAAEIVIWHKQIVYVFNCKYFTERECLHRQYLLHEQMERWFVDMGMNMSTSQNNEFKPAAV